MAGNYIFYRFVFQICVLVAVVFCEQVVSF